MQTKIKTIIIDDEPIAIFGLKKLLLKTDVIEIIDTFDNANDAINLIKNKQVDLLFLDIEMPSISGIDFLKTLKERPAVVITSAYPQYAVDGYELDVLDYLIKPIRNERLLKSIEKAKEYLELKKAKTKEQNFIFVKCEKVVEKIVLNELLYIESLLNYVAIYTINKRYLAYSSLMSIQNLLPSHQFIKVQKSFVVSIAKITSFDNKNVMIGNKIIPISRDNKKEIHEEIMNSKYLNLLK